MNIRDVIRLIISVIRLIISIAFFIGSLLLVNKLGLMEFNYDNETSEYHLKNEELRRLEDDYLSYYLFLNNK